MNFTSYLKDKRIALTLVFAVCMSIVFIQGKNFAYSDNCAGTAPQSPAFNVWPLTYDPSTSCSDLAMVDAKNLSSTDARDARYANSQAEHDQGISAVAGQRIRVSIYFHNGASDQIDRSLTTAHNVSISSNFDASSSTVHTVSAAISSAQTATLGSAAQGGNITIHTGTESTLAYVAGSTQLCVNQTAVPAGFTGTGGCGTASDGTPRVLVSLPDGIANGSVSIGDVKACFPFSGTLIYELLVQGPTSTGNAALQIVKTVRDVTKGESTFNISTQASPNDVVEFKIDVTNTGNATATQLHVLDQMPAGLSYDSTSFNSTLISANGYIAADLPAGQTLSIKFKSIVTASTGTLVNLASAVASGTGQPVAQATVGVNAPATQNTTLSITKQVSRDNATFSSNVSAHTGDQVYYKIVVTNTSTVIAQNVVVTDSGVAGITPDANFIQLTGAGAQAGNLAVGASKTYTYGGTVNATTAADLQNNAQASASNASSVQAHAIVSVTPVASQNTTLTITKQVRNIGGGQPNYGSAVNAFSGDNVDFQIVVTNSGSAIAHNVFVSDTLPSGLEFVQGSINNAVVTSAGFNYGDLNPGQSISLNFSAHVNAVPSTYTNSVSAKGSNTNTAIANANVIVAASTQNNPAVTITKGVQDLSQGQTAYVSNTNVFNGDNLQYQITVANTGNTALTNVYVIDQLPTGLNFVPGSIGFTSGGTGSTLNDHLVIGSLQPGQSVSINFRAAVNTISGTLNNIATVYTNEAGQKSAQATVNIVSRPQPLSLTVSKLVADLTSGNTGFSKSVIAHPGDKLAYKIQINATNADATNTTVLESMPTYLTYVPNSSKMNNNATSINFIGQNGNIGSITSGNATTLYLEATVNSNLPNCQSNITNTVNVSADHVGVISDTATATVNNTCPTAFSQLSISKLVKNVTYNGAATNGSFQKSVHAFNSDKVEFQVTVTNSGTSAINNVKFTDLLPTGLNLVSGSVREDNGSAADASINNSFNLGNMVSGQQHTFVFDALVSASAGQTLQNVAKTSGDSTPEVTDNASVIVDSNVASANANIQLSKRAFNDTKNVDATLVTASKEDFITYTLSVRNIGNADATSYVIQDDLSNVLNYSSMVNTFDGTLNGTLISYPAITIPAGQTVEKTFKVRVIYHLPANYGSLSLVNTFGNTVTINIQTPKILGSTFVAPKTGAGASAAFAFAGLVTAAVLVIRKKKLVPSISFE